jgi:hypothetical protein
VDLSVILHNTPKGQDEVKSRSNKLSFRKRSVLILLDKLQTVEHVLHKTVFPKDEIVSDIQELIRDGFVAVSGADATSQVADAAGVSGELRLDDEIIVSEAKFLLTDYSVDSFGMQSETISNQVRACKDVRELRVCLSGIYSLTEKLCPDRLTALVKVVAEINETA